MHAPSSYCSILYIHPRENARCCATPFLSSAQAVHQIGDGGLEIHAVPVGLAGIQGSPDARHGVVRRQSQGVSHRLAPHQGAHAGGGEDVAGAVEAGGQVLGEIAAVGAGLLVIVHDAQLARLEADAGEGHVPGTQLRKGLEHLLDIGLVVLRPVGQSREEAGLREVGDDEVRLGAHLGHLRREILPEGGIELAVVRHHGVHHDQVVRRFEGVEKGADIADLFLGGQVPGVNGVKAQLLAAPVGGDGGDLVRQILAGEVLEHGMGGEHRRGDDGAFHAHGGDDGQGHGQ